MKNYLIHITFLVLLFMSCDDSDEGITADIDGDYTGIFVRNGNSSGVELNLENQKFSGTSERVKYPAICHGAYTRSGDDIIFENQCIWTADFDWTLILNGPWIYSFQDNILTLAKSNGDMYILEKK